LKREEKFFWPELIDILDTEIKEDVKFRVFSAGEHLLTDANYQVISQSFYPDITFSSEWLTRFFQEHSAIVRAKGYLLTDKGWCLLNFTLSGCIFEPCQAKTMSEIILIAERSAAEHFQNMIDDFQNKTIILK